MGEFSLLGLQRRCRLCAGDSSLSINIFGEEGNNLNLGFKIRTYLSLNVSKDDDLPKLICYECLFCVERFHTFKIQCKQSQNILKNWDLYANIDGKDTETCESTDKTSTSLNYPSTSQQENVVPCLIDVEANDSNHNINFTPNNQGRESSDGQLIFKEDVAAYLQQIKSSFSTNLGDVNEVPKIHKPLRTKCINSTATLLHQIHSSSSNNLKRGNKPRKLQNTLSSEQVNLTISKTLVPILIDLCKAISTHTPNEITESNETVNDNCSKVVNSEQKVTPITSLEITPTDKLPESNKETTMASECSITMNDALDSPGRVTVQAQRCQPKRKPTFKSLQQSIPKSSSLALQSSKNTFEFGHILDISSENVHASDDGVALSHLSSNIHIDAIDEINSNDDENSYQDDFEELDENLTISMVDTDDSLEEQKNQSFQWRCVKKVTQSDGSVRYQCTFCKKTYCGKSYLKKHLILHTREKFYGHSISDKQLANNYMLRRKSACPNLLNSYEPSLKKLKGTSQFVRCRRIRPLAKKIASKNVLGRNKCFNHGGNISKCKEECCPRYASGVGKSINQEGIQTKIDCNGVTKTRRRCKQAGCPKNSQRRGYCIQHGGSVPKCKEDGCHRNVRKKGLCMKHCGIKVKYTCKQEGCLRHPLKGGYCVKHGGIMPKCRTEGCPKNARGGGYCMKHGVYYPKCKQEGCLRYPQSGGYCTNHGGKKYECKEKDCTKYAKGGGYCMKHGGTRTLCKVEGCSKHAKHKGYCKRHNKINSISIEVGCV